MKRFPFLDWMRGLAVVIMIQCHTFNSFARLDLRDGGPYVLSQFIGGMAAPLFLFMAGMTSGFQMESLERKEANLWRRWWISFQGRLEQRVRQVPDARAKGLPTGRDRP